MVLALVIALGVGTASALRGTGQWREESNDASFAALNYHDLRVELPDAAFVPEGAIAAEVISSNAPIAIAEERLRVPTQVDASTDGNTVLAAGILVGADFSSGGPAVDALEVRAGDGIEADAVALDVHFAEGNELAPTGVVGISGEADLRYSAHVLAPTEFFVVNERGGIFAGTNYAVVYAPLRIAQELSGNIGQVNGLVATLDPGADPEAVQAALQDHFDGTRPEFGAIVELGTEERVFRVLYDDIENDQRFYNIFATLVFLGAAFGAFNLARRMVESQRHEIGVSMALGVPVPQIAARPLLVAAQIAVLGVVLGIGVGLAFGVALRGLFEDFLPLPVWRTSFPTAQYVQAALLGVVVPVVGVAWPVWRAVREDPVDALAPRYRAGAHRLIPRLGRRLRASGSIVRRYPTRNLLRSLQRTALTAIAIGAAVAALLSVIGMVDSFRDALDRGEEALLADQPDRLSVDLDRPLRANSPTVEAIAGSDVVDRGVGVLRVGGQVLVDGQEPLDVVVEARDLGSDVWAPRVDRGDRAVDEPGLVLAEKAMVDLALDIGDQVTFRHPVISPTGGVALVDDELTVTGVHDVQLRPQTYVTEEQAGLFGLTGFVNQVDVIPTTGSSRDDVKRELFSIDEVASVQGVAETTEALSDLIDEFLGFLLIVQAVTVLLAVLISFNATSIAIDERRREHATMLAFGMRPRTVLRMMLTENLALGALGAIVGLASGALVVRWIIEQSLPDVVPDLTVNAVISGGSMVVAVVTALGATAVAALMMWTRISRIDLPSTLRVQE